eukprot:5819111-Prymnesium_polylepis.1
MLGRRTEGAPASGDGATSRVAGVLLLPYGRRTLAQSYSVKSKKNKRRERGYEVTVVGAVADTTGTQEGRCPIRTGQH